jgi:hypothetical protein
MGQLVDGCHQRGELVVGDEPRHRASDLPEVGAGEQHSGRPRIPIRVFERFHDLVMGAMISDASADLETTCMANDLTVALPGRRLAGKALT